MEGDRRKPTKAEVDSFSQAISEMRAKITPVQLPLRLRYPDETARLETAIATHNSFVEDQLKPALARRDQSTKP